MFLVYLILHRYYASRGFATVSPKKRRWLEFASIWFQIISLAISSFLVYIAFGSSDYERHQYAFLAINIGNIIIIPLIMIHSAYYWFKGDGKSLLKQEQIQSQEMQDQEAAANTNDTTETIWIVDKNRGVRAWYFLLFEILVLVNLISAIFVTKFSVYGLEDGPDTTERQILLGLQYGNVCLLIANWILCYFYSTNLTWWLPLIIVNIIGHRYYPRPIKVQRVNRNSAQHEGVPVDTLIQFLNNSRSWGMARGVRQACQQGQLQPQQPVPQPQVPQVPPPSYEEAIENQQGSREVINV